MEHSDPPYYPPGDKFLLISLLAALAMNPIVILSLASSLGELSEPVTVSRFESPAASVEELSRRVERQQQEMDQLRSRISTENSLASEETIRLILLCIAGIVFVVWIYKTRRGFAQLGLISFRDPSPFIILLLILPVINLFVLFPSVRKIWRVTRDSTEPMSLGAKAFVPIWGVSVASAFLTAPAPFVFIAAVPKPSLHLALVHLGTCALALSLTLVLVRHVTGRHEEIATQIAPGK